MKRLLQMSFIALFIASALHATSMLPMFLDDLTASSQAVVHGKVLAVRTEWDEDHRWIYTVYTVEPAEYVKGNLGTAFELREPGGEKDGMILHVPSVPVFQVGQEVLLFVWTGPKGHHQVTAFEQGAVEIVTDPQTGAKTTARPIPLGSVATPSPSRRPPPSCFPN